MPTADRDSSTLPRREEENDEPEEKGDESLTDDREEDDARSREDSCDTGEEQQAHTGHILKMNKSTLYCGLHRRELSPRMRRSSETPAAMKTGHKL